MFLKCYEDQEVINIMTSPSTHFIEPTPNGFVTFEIVLCYKKSALGSKMYHDTHLSNNLTGVFDTFCQSANSVDFLNEGQLHQ